MAIEAAKAASDKKANDCLILEMGELFYLTDYFVICSGQNPRQVKAIADNIEVALAAERIDPASVEGYAHAGWVLIDCFDFVIHVFNRETRLFYALDRLWGNARRITFHNRD